jgi:hypothetical protein
LFVVQESSRSVDCNVSPHATHAAIGAVQAKFLGQMLVYKHQNRPRRIS